MRRPPIRAPPPAEATLNSHPYKYRTGIVRVSHALLNSAAGLRAAWRSEAAFRQELALVALLLPLGIWLGRDGIERALLAGAVLQVLVVELLNTAIEYAVDRVSLEPHALSRTAKDLGTAAVLISLLLAALTWALLLLPRLLT